MTDRITIKMLENLADRINELTDNPNTPWSKNADNKMKANIGNYHISQCYGGVCLHQMFNDGGGVTSRLQNYHGPCAFLYLSS